MSGRTGRTRRTTRKTPAGARRLAFTAVLGKGRGIVARQIDDETLLVPIRHQGGGKDAIYTLNKMGTAIWRLIDGRRSVGQIRTRILEEYGVAPRRLDADLAVFFGDLLDIGALRERRARRPSLRTGTNPA